MNPHGNWWPLTCKPSMSCGAILCHRHYNNVIMSAVASQFTRVSIDYSAVCSGADQRKHQSSASLAFVRGIHWWPVNSPHIGSVARKMFSFDGVIIIFVHVMAWRLFSVQPLPKSKRTDCRVNPTKHTSVKFQSKYEIVLSRNCFWWFHLQNISYFIQASLCHPVPDPYLYRTEASSSMFKDVWATNDLSSYSFFKCKIIISRFPTVLEELIGIMAV